jgi:hypothetical protein
MDMRLAPCSAECHHGLRRDRRSRSGAVERAVRTETGTGWQVSGMAYGLGSDLGVCIENRAPSSPSRLTLAPRAPVAIAVLLHALCPGSSVCYGVWCML